MTRVGFGLLIALLAGGCDHGSNIEQLQAGMSREQVVSMMGPPQTSMQSAGRECAVYSVLKDFWSRVPWDMSARYQVCFVDDKVDYFGRVDVAEVR